MNRAIADQLEGDEEEHGKYRSMVVQYIVVNADDDNEETAWLMLLF